MAESKALAASAPLPRLYSADSRSVRSRSAAARAADPSSYRPVAICAVPRLKAVAELGRAALATANAAAALSYRRAEYAFTPRVVAACELVSRVARCQSEASENGRISQAMMRVIPPPGWQSTRAGGMRRRATAATDNDRLVSGCFAASRRHPS